MPVRYEGRAFHRRGTGFFCSFFLFFFPVLSFLSEKEKKEPKKRNLNGVEFARKPSGGPSPALRAPEGGGVLSFLSEKERKNQRKETLTGRDLRGSHRAGRPRLCARRKGRRSFFSFRKRAKEPEKRILNGGDAWKPSGGPSPALRAPEGGGVLSFLSEKARKNQRKETLTGWNLRGSHRAGRTRLCARRKGAAFFLFFQKKRERTREKNP